MSRKIELLCVDTDGTLTDGSLIYGNLNSSLGASYPLAENFERSQTASLASRPKFSPNTKSPPQNTRILDSSIESSLRGESTPFRHTERSEVSKSHESNAMQNTMSQKRINESHRFAQNQRILGDSQVAKMDSSLTAFAQNDEFMDCHDSAFAESRNDENKKNANSSIVSEKSGLRSCERGNRTNGSLTKRTTNLPDLSPQDEFAEIIKIFNVKDGLALAYFAKTLNRKVAIITGRSSEILRARAKELGIDELLFMGIRDKGAILRELKERFALDSSQIATIGDDLNDIPMFNESLCNFAPSDCADALKSLPNTTILNAKGGKGAVREAIEIILKKENLYEAFVSQFV